jgi:hypothetical protein
MRSKSLHRSIAETFDYRPKLIRLAVARIAAQNSYGCPLRLGTVKLALHEAL